MEPDPKRANESIRVSYVLAEDSQVEMQLSDARGRMIDQQTLRQSEGDRSE